MDIKSVEAFRSYAQARQSVLLQEPKTDATEPGAKEFSDVAKTVAREAVQTLSAGEQTALDAIAGKADPTTVVQALAAAELTLETASTIRDRVVEAYQEILRMPV